MNVVIRVDASKIIGTGHVARCLTLASSLKARGADVFFVCRTHEGNLCKHIESEGFFVKSLELKNDKNISDKRNYGYYASWLGASLVEDAEDTRLSILSLGGIVDWLVVDHYAIDASWERELHSVSRRIFVIDDLADRSHECNYLVDQNIVENMYGRYQSLVLDSCNALIGPKYALLRPDYHEKRKTFEKRGQTIKRILISFGGTDLLNITTCIINAFLILNINDICLDVVVPSNSVCYSDICDLVASHKNIALHSDLSSLAPLMLEADISIGACGGTTWERLCLGLPSLVIILAENQRKIAEELERRGLVIILGDYRNVDENTISKRLEEVVANGVDREWVKRCWECVDGLGTSRICDVFFVEDSDGLVVRLARFDDKDLLFDWANDPTTRMNAFSTEMIPFDTHILWLQSKLDNVENCKLYIIETIKGIPIGQVRLDRIEKNTWELSYLVSPLFRKRGFGKKVIGLAIEYFMLSKCNFMIVAKVKASNVPSQKIFRNIGFVENRSEDGSIFEYVFCSNVGSFA